MLRWRENERADADTTYKDNIDASKTKSGSGFISGTGKTSLDNGCNTAGFTCHLQYIPVSARCAPDFWAGQTWHFCAGA